MCSLYLSSFAAGVLQKVHNFIVEQLAPNFYSREVGLPTYLVHTITLVLDLRVFKNHVSSNMGGAGRTPNNLICSEDKKGVGKKWLCDL